MLIHFVCTGNIYRSRLSEAYIRSKQIPGLTFSSSGTEASRNTAGPISWYASRIIFLERLVPFTTLMWQDTTKQLLDQADLVVFMKQSHYNYCKEALNFTKNNYEIWDIPDIDMEDPVIFEQSKNTPEVILRQADQTFKLIKNNVDQLIVKLAK